VAFYWREANAEEHENAVPLELTEDLTSIERCMKGTGTKHNNKCIALRGRVGEEVACSIYPNRPSPCRRFTASYENGKKNDRCDLAREHHGLPPLRREDWDLVLLNLRPQI
jgi:Fe-S-cluster containining protein